MELTQICSPDINEIDATIKLYEGKKIAFIKSKILSGEYDNQLLNIALTYPFIPILYFSGVSGELIMSEGYNTREYFFNDDASKFLETLYGEQRARECLEGISRYLNMSPYEIRQNSIIRIPLSDEKSYVVSLIEEDIETFDEYSYAVCYYSDQKYIFLSDYWEELLNANKEAFKNVLDTYLEDEDGEEIVDIDEL